MHPISAYLVVLAGALFSAGWAVMFYRFYSHIDDKPDRDRHMPH